jgi:hypothetical protein
MESCRAAERALVAALVMGQADPAELSGRLRSSDFTDPAAGACFAAALGRTGAAGAVLDLPELLRSRGVLRSDGYPIRELLEWLPSLPVPTHPEAWATLVVAGSMGRVVQACGTRLVQVTDGWDLARPEAGRVLTMAAAQRAALHGALRRWDDLPAAWRDTLPARSLQRIPPPEASRPTLIGDRELEREVLAGAVAVPALLDRMPWLRQDDFTDPGCAEVFRAVRQLHGAGRPVDLVTLAASLVPAARSGADLDGPAEVCAGLRPGRSFPAAVPFVARRLLEATAVREARQVGEDLLVLAASPGSVGGLGRPVLEASLGWLDRLRPHAERLVQAYRPAAGRTVELTRRGVSRLPVARRVPTTDRFAG